MYSISKSKLFLLLFFASIILKAQLFQNGQSAAFVLGATSTNAAGTLGTSAQKFTTPVAQSCYVIDAKHNCVWVADYFGHRVLRFQYPFTSDFPTANLVLGQTNFSSCNYGGLTSSSLGNPQGLAVDTVTGNLFVLCISQNRVLRFNSAHLLNNNGSFANAVFGQIHYGNSFAGTSPAQFNFNQAPACGNLLHYDQLSGALWVSDNNNARVMRFDNANTLTVGASASAVLGQTTFTTSSNGLTASKFARPDGITTVGTSLFVSDPLNNRILRFDNVYSKSNGASADAVIGQSAFTTSNTGTSATQLNNPTGLCASQSQLIVADAGNNRVLVYDSPLLNATATSVLLAPTFTQVGSAATTPSTGGASYNVTFDGLRGQLLVQDRQNSRVLIFRSCPTIQISGPTSICSGASITLSATGVTNFTWSTNQTVPTISVNPITTSNYSVTALYSSPVHTCYTSAVKTISVLASPIITVNSGSICEGQNFTLTANGALSYTYSSSSIVSPTSTTTYSVSGTGANGCTSFSAALATVSVEALPVISVQNGSICSGQSFTINPSGAANYTIQGGTNIVNPTTTSTYTVHGSSTNGCNSAAPALCKVSVYASPTISAVNGSVCSGQSYTLTASGANTYSIQGGSFVVTPLFTSTYTINGISNQGCASPSAIIATVSVFPRPTISLTSGTICSGQTFTLNPTGAATYVFEGGSAIVSPTVSTSYTCFGYSAEGCKSLNTVKCKIKVNQNPLVSINVLPEQTCLNGGPVQVIVNPPGGNVLGYAVSNSTFLPTYLGSLTVSYNFTDVTTGCSASDTASLKVEACTGLTQTNTGRVPSVYPNPTKNTVTVQFGDYETKEIVVSDMLGRVITSENELSDRVDYSIDLRAYSNGIYFVSLKSNNETKTIKVIKE